MGVRWYWVLAVILSNFLTLSLIEKPATKSEALFKCEQIVRDQLSTPRKWSKENFAYSIMKGECEMCHQTDHTMILHGLEKEKTYDDYYNK